MKPPKLDASIMAHMIAHPDRQIRSKRIEWRAAFVGFRIGGIPNQGRARGARGGGTTVVIDINCHSGEEEKALSVTR